MQEARSGTTRPNARRDERRSSHATVTAVQVVVTTVRDPGVTPARVVLPAGQAILKEWRGFHCEYFLG